MADITQGINPTQVDTTPQFSPGLIADDPRGGAFSGCKLKYVKAGGNLAVGDAAKIDTSTTDEPATVIQTTAAADQQVEGIANVAIASGSYGWISVGGRVAAAKVAAGTAAGVTLMTSAATAGTLATSVGGTAANALAMGRRITTLDAEAGGLAECYIY